MLQNLLVALGLITSIGVQNAVVRSWTPYEKYSQTFLLPFYDDTEVESIDCIGNINSGGLYINTGFSSIYNSSTHTLYPYYQYSYLDSIFLDNGRSTINESDSVGFLPIFNYSTGSNYSGSLFTDSTGSHYVSSGYGIITTTASYSVNVALFSQYHTSLGTDQIIDYDFNSNLYNIYIQCNRDCHITYSLEYISIDEEIHLTAVRDMTYTGVQTGFNSSSLTNNLTLLPMNNMLMVNNIDLWKYNTYLNGNQYGLDLSNCSFFHLSIKLLYDEAVYDYDHGYTDGYNNGQNNGYNQGYTAGFNAGSSSNTRLLNLFSSIADTPVLMIRSMFSFELFGISMYTAVLSLITLLFILFIVKRLL